MHYEAIMTDAQKARFHEHYIRQPNGGCWLWIKKARHAFGYGLFSIGRYADGTQKQVTAHRLSYDIANGPIPEGMMVLHKCDVPACVNPDHLYAGTHHDNMRDAAERGRAKHYRAPPGERHPRAKLSDAEVEFIRRSDEQGVKLAARYGVSASHICGIRKGRYRNIILGRV